MREVPKQHLFLLARELAAKAGDSVTLIGSGQPSTEPYRFLHASSIRREYFEPFPKMPVFRHQFAYEEMTFVPALLRQYSPADWVT